MMRPTWHFVDPRDIRWILSLTSARVEAQNARLYRRVELDDDVFKRCQAYLEGALKGTNLSREELGKSLTETGIPASGQRLAYILMHAELAGLVCSGPRRGKQFTYALLEERAPKAKQLGHDEALAELTMMYFRSHGPAQRRDFAWWSGLTARDVGEGVALAGGRLASAEMDGKSYLFSAEGMPFLPWTRHDAHLISLYDEYTIAYNDRSAIGEGRVLEEMISRGNAVTSVLLLDGRVAGSWRRTARRAAVRIELRPFEALAESQRAAVELAARRYGEFVEAPVEIVWE